MPILAAYMVPHPPMIVPEVGRGSEHQIEATRAAYARIAREIAALAPETIIISSPHATMYADYFHISPGVRAEGSFARFRAPQVCFSEEYDAELARTIERMAIACGLPAGTRGQREPALDHGTLVPLYFIRQAYAGFRLVRVGLSGLPLEDHYRLGQLIRRAVGRRAAGRSTSPAATCPTSCRPTAPTATRRRARSMTRASWMCVGGRPSASCSTSTRPSASAPRSAATGPSSSWPGRWTACPWRRNSSPTRT